MVKAPLTTQSQAQTQQTTHTQDPGQTQSPEVYARLQMSAEDFLRWEHPGIAEWVNGEVIIVSVKQEHQRVVDFLNALLRLFTQFFKLGSIVSAPYAMRITPDGNLREPDLMFIASAHTQRITSSLLEGPADLVIEVVSEGSVEQDYDAKFIEYQKGAVREYWIIDPRPERMRASFFVLHENGHYRPVPPDEAGTYCSTVLPAFRLKIEWLWQDPPPPIDDLMLEIGGDAYAQHLIERLRQRGLLAS
jgi:Uma2 family endonuclease